MNNSPILITIIIILMSCSVRQPESKNNINTALKNTDTTYAPKCSACFKFDSLYLLIRDGKISKSDAKKEISKLIPQIKNYYKNLTKNQYSNKDWMFPVEGYKVSNIGGIKDNGFITQNYDFYDGNKHVGHPAFDIFIYDRNQDCIDDRTAKDVKIISMTEGIVISAISKWEPGEEIRGGVCMYIYEPSNDYIIYYAHNKDIYVKTGDILKPGDTIATVGRTGKNAYKQRSPTHLHIMCLKVDTTGNMLPVNIYNDLSIISK